MLSTRKMVRLKRKKILIFEQNKRYTLPNRRIYAMILVVAKVKNIMGEMEVHLVYDYDITAGGACQIDELLHKLKPKREWAIQSAAWLSKHISISASANNLHCGDYITLLADRDLERKKVETAFFCKQRMCPGCAWRESLKNATCVSAISQAARDNGKIMLMATLTVPNVPGDMLRDACLHINQSWDKLIRRAKYRLAWSDNIRKLEITYNAQRDDYHPHLHVIIYVQPGYFKGEKYISRAQLLEDWRHATGIDEITQVDIRRCKDLGDRSQAVLEVSKYAAKAADFCQTESVFDTFYESLKHLKTMSYAGICKQLRRDYIAGKLNAYLPVDDTEYVWRLVYQYHEQLGYVHTDTIPYEQPTPIGYHELVGNVTPWDAPSATTLAEVT